MQLPEEETGSWRGEEDLSGLHRIRESFDIKKTGQVSVASGIRHAFFTGQAFIKPPWYGTSSFQYWVLGLSLVIFLAAAITLPAGALLWRQSRSATPSSSIREAGAARIAGWAGLLLALLSLAFWLTFFMLTRDLDSLSFGLPPLANALLFVSWAILPLTGCVLIIAWLALRRKYWTRAERVLYTVLALVGMAHVWFLIYWNLLN